MYEVSIKTHFSAAHHLKGYKGCCSKPHGHNWEVTVHIRGRDLDKLGILVDFRLVKSLLKKALDKLDHADLNKVRSFAGRNPTSENIARHLYDELRKALPPRRCRLARVTVSETPGNLVEYREDEREQEKKVRGKG